MASTTYIAVLELLKGAGVSTASSEASIGRLLKQRGLTTDDFTAVMAREFVRNLEGLVILQGDQTRVDWLGQQLETLV